MANYAEVSRNRIAKLFTPPRKPQRGETGRHDCNLCTDTTSGQAVVIFIDPKQDLGNQVRRAHLSCLESNLPTSFLLLKGDW